MLIAIYISSTRDSFSIHQNDIKINCTQTVQRKHFPWFSFHHLKRMAAINQLNKFLNKKQLLQYRVCMASKYLCFFIAYDITRSHKNKATSSK